MAPIELLQERLLQLKWLWEAKGVEVSTNKIVFSECDKGFGQVGGSVRIGDVGLWPCAPGTGQPMTPLCTITESFLPAKVFPAGMAATVFVTTRPSVDGCFDQEPAKRFAVHHQDELACALNGHAKIILHSLSEEELPAPHGAVLLDRRYIDFEEMTDAEFDDEHADEDSGLAISKQLGRASWLHEPIYPSSRFLLLLQLTERDIATWQPEHAGIFSGGVGYFYLDKQARRKQQGDEAGFFFIQFKEGEPLPC